MVGAGGVAQDELQEGLVWPRKLDQLQAGGHTEDLSQEIVQHQADAGGGHAVDDRGAYQGGQAQPIGGGLQETVGYRNERT